MKLKKYDSFYIGKVEDNKDPQKVGRLKIRVPNIHGDEVETPEIPDWAEPCFPYGGYDDEGFFFIPTVKARVLVAFVNGDPTKPIWFGCQHSQFPEQGFPMPPLEAYEDDEAYVYRKQIKTPTGYILWDDAADRFCFVHRSGSYIVFTEEGDINIKPSRNMNIEAPGNISISSLTGCVNIHADQYANISAKNQGVAVTSALSTVNIISASKDINLNAAKNINLNAGQSIIENAKKTISSSAIDGVSIAAKTSSISVGDDLGMVSNNKPVELSFE